MNHQPPGNGKLSQEESKLSPLIPQQPTICQKRRIGFFITKKTIVAGSFILLIIGASLAAVFLHVPSGRKQWTFQTGSSNAGSSPIVFDGMVYIGSNNGRIFALDVTSGQERWSFQMNVSDTKRSIGISLAATNGLVFVEGSSTLYALDAASGQKRWTFPAVTSMGVAPVVVNGLVYIGTESGQLYALDAFSGHQKWSFQTRGFIAQSPTVANGLVYISSLGGDLYALNARSGQEKWSFASAEQIETSPIVVGKVVYTVGLHGMVNALDAESGKEMRSFVVENNVIIHSSLTIANGFLYANSGKTLYAFDTRTGQEKWSYQTGSYIYASPTIASSVIYVGSEDKSLYALNALTGHAEWSYQTGGAIASTPIVVNNIVYVGSDDGNVYALQAP